MRYIHVDPATLELKVRARRGKSAQRKGVQLEHVHLLDGWSAHEENGHVTVEQQRSMLTGALNTLRQQFRGMPECGRGPYVRK
jgi:hypothetical protein